MEIPSVRTEDCRKDVLFPFYGNRPNLQAAFFAAACAVGVPGAPAYFTVVIPGK
jgi:hypothetical protein